MVQVLIQRVFHIQNLLNLLFELRLVVIQLADLEADLRVFIRIKRCDAGFGGTKGLGGQTRFLHRIHFNMVRHHDLHTVRNHQLRLRNSALPQGIHLLDEVFHTQRNAIADDVGRVIVKYARGELVQRELAIFVDNGMARIAAALVPDHDVGLRRHDVGNFPFSFIAPIGAYYRFYH